MLPEVWFVTRDAARWTALAEQGEAAPRAAAPWFRSGPEIWIGQTWMQLRARGLPVQIADRLVPGRICVVHHDELRAQRASWRSFLVVVRADRSPVHTAEMVLVQNRSMASDRHRHLHVPHWPQPGLRPRDPARGARVERVGYLGEVHQLDHRLRSDDFRGDLAGLGLELVLREEHWEDYRDLDAVVAWRGGLPARFLATKPASKLVNAWLAGCPAVVGPEPAFQELRRSDDDFLEARTPADVLRALERLVREPGLWTRMVENGRARARAFTAEAVATAWEELLVGPVADAWRRWAARGGPIRALRPLRHGVRSARQALARLRFRWQVFGRLTRPPIRNVGWAHEPPAGERGP